MDTLTSTYEIRAIEPEVVAALRECDDAGQPPRLMTADGGGNPMRCCLRASRPGEELALVSYAPLRRWAQETLAEPGPYDEVGPVFIHPESCEGFASDSVPGELLASPRVYRAYSSNGAILRGRLVEPGGQPERVLDKMFADAEVAIVHAQALEFGCFTFEARRVTVDQRP